MTEIKDKPRKRVGRLDTPGRVASEIGRVYREARRGDLDKTDATKLVSMLGVQRQVLETAELERRIDEIEARARRKAENQGATMTPLRVVGGK